MVKVTAPPIAAASKVRNETAVHEIYCTTALVVLPARIQTLRFIPERRPVQSMISRI